MTTLPLPLAVLLDDGTRANMDLLYGPGWHVNDDVEMVPTNWAAMTKAERQRGRQRIMDLWCKKGWTAA